MAAAVGAAVGVGVHMDMSAVMDVVMVAKQLKHNRAEIVIVATVVAASRPQRLLAMTEPSVKRFVRRWQYGNKRREQQQYVLQRQRKAALKRLFERPRPMQMQCVPMLRQKKPKSCGVLHLLPPVLRRCRTAPKRRSRHRRRGQRQRLK